MEGKKEKKSKKVKKAITPTASMDLSAVLGGGDKDFAEAGLASLFDSAVATAVPAPPSSAVTEAGGSRRSRQEEEEEEEAVVGELDGRKRPTKHPKPDPEEEKARLERTIFVGGVPVSNKQEKLAKHFSKYGPVESVRFRSIAFTRMSNPQMRRVGYIKGTFNPNQETCNAYVVFEQKASAELALAENGKDDFAEGFHLRVDTAVEPTISHKKSIFIGNLPFDASERAVREAFAEIGPIEYVRLVRDKVTSLGRGYAYVCFEKREGAKAAAELTNVKVGGRVLRIERCKKPSEGGEKVGSGKNAMAGRNGGGGRSGSTVGRGRGGGGRDFKGRGGGGGRGTGRGRGRDDSGGRGRGGGGRGGGGGGRGGGGRGGERVSKRSKQ